MANACAVVRRLVQAGVLTKDTHRNTIRFAPPLIIDESQIDWAVERLAEVLEETAAHAM
jgi:ornithine--oxo-acid transaminase